MRSVGSDDLTQGRPVLRTECIIPVMERFKQSILPSVAAAKLGIPGEAFMRLVKVGLIQPCPQIANTIVRLDAKNIEAFRRQMFGKSAEVAHLSDKWIPLNHAGQNFGYKLDRVCKLILNGSFGIVRHCSTASSLYHLHLNKADVHEYMSATAAIGYSKAELRQILAVNDPTVSHIVCNGMISGIALKNPHNNKKMIRFLSDEIDAFLRQYLPLGLFARNAKMQPRAAMPYFAKLDLKALDWPPKYSRIYCRADLPSEISRMQIGWAPPTG